MRTDIYPSLHLDEGVAVYFEKCVMNRGDTRPAHTYRFIKGSGVMEFKVDPLKVTSVHVPMH